MATEFYIAERWKELFNQNKLSSFEDFFENDPRFVFVAEEKSTSVFKFTVNDSTFFLKRILPEHIKKVTRSLLRGKGFWNPVADEVRNLNHLEKTGLPLMKLAAWGIKKNLGFPKASFIISEQVEGEDFMDLYDRSGSGVKRLIYREYAKIMAEVHNNGIDTLIRPQDLFCKLSPDQNSLKLTIIDREEGSTKKVVYTEAMIAKEMALIFYKFIKRYERLCISLKDVLAFSDSYLNQSKIIIKEKKDFYDLLLKTLSEVMSKRKSQQFVKNLLPKNTFKRNQQHS